MTTHLRGYQIGLHSFHTAQSGRNMVVDGVENWGARVLRVSLHPETDQATHEEFLIALENCLRAFDGAIAEAQARNVQLILCLHNYWGEGDRDANFGQGQFHKRKYRKKFYSDWEAITTRYQGTLNLFAFEVSNEPMPGWDQWNKWNKQARRVCRKIRALDSTRVLIVPGCTANPRYFSELKPVTVSRFNPTLMQNVFYCYHVYDPMEITHQVAGVNFYPSDQFKKRTIKKALKHVKEFQDTYGVGLVSTEFGCFAASGYPSNQNNIQWTKDVIDLIENHLDTYLWCYHTIGANHPMKPSKPFEPCPGNAWWCAQTEDENNELSLYLKGKMND